MPQLCPLLVLVLALAPILALAHSIRAVVLQIITLGKTAYKNHMRIIVLSIIAGIVMCVGRGRRWGSSDFARASKRTST